MVWARRILLQSARAPARATNNLQNAPARHMNKVYLMSVRFVHTPRAVEKDPQTLALEFPRQTTILANVASSTIQDQITRALRKNFRGSEATWAKLSSSEPPGLVILATPKFAKWLEDDAGFIPRVLEAVSISPKPSASDYHKKHSFEIDVFCACVDGLSPSVEYMPNQSLAMEGFSFLQGSVASILPRLWEEENTGEANQDTRSSITISGGDTWQNNVTVPLANTLFQTGKPSFLRASKWTRKINHRFIKLNAIDKNHQTINAFNDMQSNDLLSYIPATPLTPARQIESGLGNIVRVIDFGPEEGHGPASKELESQVDEYRNNLSKNRKLKASPFAVWALVVPEAALRHSEMSEPESMLRLQLSMKEIRVESHNDKFHDYIGHWINRGATICRVLSGGGGWGVKQGLLSLDPQKTYNEVEEPQLDFSHGSLEVQQISALGNMAEPGAYIQFFVGNPGRLLSTPDKRLNSIDPKKRIVVIGTTPSTIDDIPSTTVSEDDDEIRIRNGYFGCVSQSGIYLSKKSSGFDVYDSQRASFGTKIDVPYSYLFSWMDSAVIPKNDYDEDESNPGTDFSSNDKPIQS